jgi:hypothetical protein
MDMKDERIGNDINVIGRSVKQNVTYITSDNIRIVVKFTAGLCYKSKKSIVDIFGDFDYDPATTKEQAEQILANYIAQGLDDYYAEALLEWINSAWQ